MTKYLDNTLLRFLNNLNINPFESKNSALRRKLCAVTQAVRGWMSRKIKAANFLQRSLPQFSGCLIAIGSA
jgi:hypothetical protein